MSVFAVAVAVWLLLQLLALSWPARVVRPAVVLAAVVVGVYGSGALAFILQTLVNRTVAWFGTEPFAVVVERAGYSYDPVLEEFAKLVPLVLVVASATWVRRQWGLTDHLVLGAALGAGFGFLEAVVTTDPAVSDPARVIGAHVGWSALAGLGVGLLTRYRGVLRISGMLPILLAILLHIRANLVELRSALPLGLGSEPSTIVAWLLPFAGLVIALITDARVVRAGKRARPDLLLAAERSGVSSFRTIVDLGWLRVPYSTMVAVRYVRLRRAVYYAGADLTTVEPLRPADSGPVTVWDSAGPPASATTPVSPAGLPNPAVPNPAGPSPPAQPSRPLWRLARSIRADLDAANHAAAWQRLEPRRLWSAARAAAASPFSTSRGSRTFLRGLAAAAAVPVVLFVFLGSIPGFGGLRQAMVTELGTVLALLASVAVTVFLGWRMRELSRISRRTADYPLADPIALVRLTYVGAIGTVVAGVALATALGYGLVTSPASVVPGVHLHLISVLCGAPVELSSWLASGFVLVAAIGITPPSSVSAAAVGPLGLTMLRLAGDRDGGQTPTTVVTATAPRPAPARLDRSMRELRPSEQRTALLVAQQERFRGRTFRRPDSWSLAAMHVDWVDDAGGRYDAYGGWATGPDGDMRRFLDRLDMHLARDVDYTVVDLTGCGRWQVAVVAAHLEHPPPGVREHLHKLIRVGF